MPSWATFFFMPFALFHRAIVFTFLYGSKLPQISTIFQHLNKYPRKQIKSILGAFLRLVWAFDKMGQWLPNRKTHQTTPTQQRKNAQILTISTPFQVKITHILAPTRAKVESCWKVESCQSRKSRKSFRKLGKLPKSKVA